MISTMLRRQAESETSATPPAPSPLDAALAALATVKKPTALQLGERALMQLRDQRATLQADLTTASAAHRNGRGGPPVEQLNEMQGDIRLVDQKITAAKVDLAQLRAAELLPRFRAATGPHRADAIRRIEAAIAEITDAAGVLRAIDRGAEQLVLEREPLPAVLAGLDLGQVAAVDRRIKASTR